ncbi:MAG: hypothetical protein IKS87_09620 [Lachnospiraceae bacterium]|nr:hypothetical protein [Lachnospiraceae bacterium]
MENTRKITTGLLLAALAVCLILWKLNVFNLPVALAGVSTWGLIVSAIMLVIIIHSLLDLNFAGLFVPLAVIGIVFDEPLGITAITPWTILIAAALLTVAFDMLFSKHKIRRHFARHRGGHFSDRYATEVSDEDEGGHITHGVRFGSATKYVRNSNLASADLSAQFGQLSVFFDGAQVPSGRVDLDCNVSFGELDVYIPKTWHVENRVGVTLGNCDDRYVNPGPGAEIVTCCIDGSVSFGEMKLIRV